LAETVNRGQKFIPVAEVILAVLEGHVAAALQQVSNCRILRLQTKISTRESDFQEPGTELPPEKRQQVQERMLGPEVLDSNQFHEIRFQAKDVKEESTDHFLLAGTLSLHGKTRPISFHVVRSGGHYRGDVMLKQRDFGITPVTVAGGTVKVKDELKIELDISAEAKSRQAENNR
jgi:hypothetical protein